MIELQKVNTGPGQLCRDDNFGTIFRSHSSKYFYVIAGHKADILMLGATIKKHILLPPNSVPRRLIKKNRLASYDPKVTCTGCGEVFKESQMDGTLCRGLDGCSAKKEIAEIKEERKRQEILERIRKLKGLKYESRRVHNLHTYSKMV